MEAQTKANVLHDIVRKMGASGAEITWSPTSAEAGLSGRTNESY